MKNAINDGNTQSIKSVLIGLIGSDPTFCTTHFHDACTLVKNNGIDLEENYHLQDDEKQYPTDTSKWTNEYFGLLLIWFKDNYCIDKRLPHIKIVGKYVYKNSNTMGKMIVKQQK